MSKNFETEYKALATCEAPDLWERIEAGLTPRLAEIPENINGTEKADEKRKAGSVTYFMKKYKPVLIAAMCVLVILPAAMRLGQMGIAGGSETTESAMEYETAAADSAPAAMAEESTVMEETVEATEEMATEEAPAEGAAMWTEAETEAVTEEDFAQSGIEEMQENISNAEKENTRLESAGSENVESKLENTDSMEAAELQSDLMIADGTILEHVSIKLIGEEIMKETAYPEVGNFYRVEIIKDKNAILEEGEEILLFVPENISQLTILYETEGQSEYEIAVEYDNSREYPFYLKECY